MHCAISFGEPILPKAMPPERFAASSPELPGMLFNIGVSIVLSHSSASHCNSFEDDRDC